VRVGLNLVFLVPGETGGRETYARKLVGGLRTERPDLDLTVFVNRETADAGGFENLRAVVVPLRARRRHEWAAAEQIVLPRLVAQAGVDVLHSLANTAPGWGSYARVVTIHDTLFRRHPEFHTRAALAGTSALLRLAARRSHRVITVSEAAANDIVATFSLPRSKIDVVPNGVARPAPIDPDLGSALRRRLGLAERPLVLAVATRLPHKNLGLLIGALAALSTERRPALLLAGQATSLDRELTAHARALGVESDVVITGRLSARELEAAYAAASCLAVPSLYEGFGLPVLEAMVRGVPVVCSDIPALREVAGDAASFFGPRDPRAAATAIDAILADPRLADSLRDRGRARAARFSWTAAARATAASYERAMMARSARTKTRFV